MALRFVSLVSLLLLLLAGAFSAAAAPAYDVGTLYPVADVTISSSSGSNLGTLNVLHVGHRLSSGATRRFLIKFDLSSIPADAVISSVSLRLFVAADNAANDANVAIYRSLVPWDELQATWNNWATGFPWSVPGGAAPDYVSVALGNQNILSSVAVGSPVDIGINPVEFKKYVTGEYTNLGFYLRSVSESDNAIDFYSREEANSSLRPALIVNYSVPSPTPTNTATVTYTPSLTLTPFPTITNTSTPSATPTITNTPVVVSSATNTPSPTVTSTPLPNQNIPSEVCIHDEINPIPGLVFAIFNPVISVVYFLVVSLAGQCYWTNGSGSPVTIDTALLFISLVMFYFVHYLFARWER